MHVEAQLGADRPLLKEQYFTSVIFVFQLCGLLDRVLRGRGRHWFSQLHCWGAVAPSPGVAVCQH